MSAAWHISRTALNTVLCTAYSSSCPLPSSFYLGIGRPAYQKDRMYCYHVNSCFSCTSALIFIHWESGRHDFPPDRIKEYPVYCSSSCMTDINKQDAHFFSSTIGTKRTRNSIAETAMERRRNRAGKRIKWIVIKRMAEKIGQRDRSGYHRGQKNNRKNKTPSMLASGD